jgi:hypothetical protein
MSTGGVDTAKLRIGRVLAFCRARADEQRGIFDGSTLRDAGIVERARLTRLARPALAGAVVMEATRRRAELGLADPRIGSIVKRGLNVGRRKTPKLHDSDRGLDGAHLPDHGLVGTGRGWPAGGAAATAIALRSSAGAAARASAARGAGAPARLLLAAALARDPSAPGLTALSGPGAATLPGRLVVGSAGARCGH